MSADRQVMLLFLFRNNDNGSCNAQHIIDNQFEQTTKLESQFQ